MRTVATPQLLLPSGEPSQSVRSRSSRASTATPSAVAAGLVAASDIAIAAESAMFGFTEVRLGLVPATVAPHVIEKIGPGRALPLFLTGERFDAQRALAIGLVHQVVPDTDVDVAVATVVDQLLSGGPNAHGWCKELVRRVGTENRTQIDEYTAALIASARAGDEGREGVGAFLEKRKPSWVIEGS